MRRLILCVWSASVFSLGSDAETQSLAQAHRSLGIFQPFSYEDVILTDGPLAAQARSAREFYLALSDANLLNGFRLRADMPAPGQPMGGWYDPDGFAGAHPFGQYLSGLSRMYAATGDARFKTKVAELVHGFHETISPDGFFFSSQKVATNWPCYLYDKNCIGMRDAFTLTGNPEALDVLKVMTDWAVKNLPRRNDEWYTLPENLYSCYTLTKDERYLKMAAEYDYSTDYYDLFAGGTNAFTPQRHAYSHVNALCSAAKAYEMTGEEKYLKAVSNAWEFLTGTQMYASGGWGPNERFVTAGEGKLTASLTQTNFHFQTRNHDYANHFETPCGSYANINFDRYLLRFTGDPKYGDNMERVLFNGILAALPMQPDGRTFYYSDYHPGAHKQYFTVKWPCCSGTYAQVTADYPTDIYFHNDNEFFVNLFTPSHARWRRNDQTINIEQATHFPQSDTTTLKIHATKPARFTLSVRVPAWIAGPERVILNGTPQKPGPTSDGRFRLDRIWHEGDTVMVTFPMSLRFEPIDAQTTNMAALMYGPILLVAMADGVVHLSGDQAKPASWIQPLNAVPQSFQTRDNLVIFRPLYLVKDEHYTTYCNVEAPTH